MKIIQSSLLVTLLMLMTFVGQTMASTTMLCVHESSTADTSKLAHHDNDNSADGDTHHHGMLTMESNEKASEMDCCQEQCQCPMNGCFSLSVLVNNTFNPSLKGEQKITQLSSLALSQINSSLYRPPIS